jgi:hypothetical protein
MSHYTRLQEIRGDWMSPKTIAPWLEHYKEFQNVRVLPTKERTPDVLWRAFYASVYSPGPFNVTCRDIPTFA